MPSIGIIALVAFMYTSNRTDRLKPVPHHRPSRSVGLIALLVFAAGCAATTPAPPQARPAPWSGPALSKSDVPAVYLTEWRKAENRATCAPIAPVTLGAGEGATPRRANFAGGWAVAYDRPGQRSAFGIAGTGSNASDGSYTGWEFSKEWADGGTAGYGLEGGSGPGWLAYVRIPGQQCLYNVWSNISVEHLELLLENLRFVETE